MSLLDVLRSGVEIANRVTRPIQATVMYKRETGTDEYGAKTYATAVPLHAIVDFQAKQVRTREGVLTVTRATITLLDIAEIVAATNGQGIDNDDQFIFPDGDSGPTLDIGGFVDAGTGNPIATTVMIG